MTEERHSVLFTEAEINALVTAIGKIRLTDVHSCRIIETHTGLQELKEAQAVIRITKE